MLRRYARQAKRRHTDRVRGKRRDQTAPALSTVRVAGGHCRRAACSRLARLDTRDWREHQPPDRPPPSEEPAPHCTTLAPRASLGPRERTERTWPWGTTTPASLLGSSRPLRRARLAQGRERANRSCVDAITCNVYCTEISVLHFTLHLKVRADIVSFAPRPTTGSAPPRITNHPCALAPHHMSAAEGHL